MEKTGYYVFGGEVRAKCYGWARTLLGAKRLSGRNEELKARGWSRPDIYCAEDCTSFENEFGTEIIYPKDGSFPVAQYDIHDRKWY